MMPVIDTGITGIMMSCDQTLSLQCFMFFIIRYTIRKIPVFSIGNSYRELLSVISIENTYR